LSGFLSYLVSSDKKLSKTLKNILGFYPGNIDLYAMALRHKSLSRGNAELALANSNERLEFLGDALLDAVVADHLFHIFPYKDEGFLTKMRSKIVSRQHLNGLALKLGLHELLEKEGGTTPGTSIYGNALEALIGSIYLDKGYPAAKKFILIKLFGIYIDIEEVENTETDFKSKLTEWAQKEKKNLEFRVLEEARNNENRNYIVGVFINDSMLGQASNYSKKRAEQIAAEKAWESINLQL
jgi:ribonuclease-3